MAKAPAKKTTAKAAPAPVQENDVVELEVGQSVKFLGYDEETPAEERVLTQDEVYEIVDFTEADENGDSFPVVRIPNPDFNAKKKEHPDTNPKTIDVEVFPEEIELVEAEVDEEAEAEAAAVAEAATKKAATTAKAAGKGKEAAAPAGKGKAAATKPAAAKPAAKTPAKVEQTEATDTDELPDLDNEDPEVLALVGGDADLIAVAQNLEGDVAVKEYQLGGVLFHIKKEKPYLELIEEGQTESAYAVPGGFRDFIRDYLNIDYRKAMYLIDIYVAFTQAGIADASAVVAAMGWTKASKIARPMLEDGANVESLIELAQNNTVADLSTALTEQVTVGGTKKEGGEKVTRTTVKFRWFEEEAATNQSILETAMGVYGVEDIGAALTQILQDWSASQAEESGATAAVAPKQSTPATKTAPAARKKATAKA